MIQWQVFAVAIRLDWWPDWVGTANKRLKWKCKNIVKLCLLHVNCWSDHIHFSLSSNLWPVSRFPKVLWHCYLSKKGILTSPSSFWLHWNSMLDTPTKWLIKNIVDFLTCMCICDKIWWTAFVNNLVLLQWFAVTVVHMMEPLFKYPKDASSTDQIKSNRTIL